MSRGSKNQRSSLVFPALDWSTGGNRYFASRTIPLLVAILSIVCYGSGTNVHAFGNPRTLIRIKSTRSAAGSVNTLPHAVKRPNRSIVSLDLSNDNNNNGNNNNDLFDLGLLSRRFERADKMEIRNDATLVTCYVLCRFLVWDITSGTKIVPGWELQDWIYISGTFSSAIVLMVYYMIAGLLSQTYQTPSSSSWGAPQPSPVLKALVNVALCCPIWLYTEHLLGFGPANIGGNTFPVAAATGFVGFGSFMALAKVLTDGMR